MTTLVCYITNPIEDDNAVKFFTIEEDWTRFHNVWINASNTGKEDELCDLVYTNQGYPFFQEAPNHPDPTWKWDIAITCGFFL